MRVCYKPDPVSKLALGNGFLCVSSIWGPVFSGHLPGAGYTVSTRPAQLSQVTGKAIGVWVPFPGTCQPRGPWYCLEQRGSEEAES